MCLYVYGMCPPPHMTVRVIDNALYSLVCVAIVLLMCVANVLLMCCLTECSVLIGVCLYVYAHVCRRTHAHTHTNTQ